jgi:hypothetical protein
MKQQDFINHREGENAEYAGGGVTQKWVRIYSTGFTYSPQRWRHGHGRGDDVH